MNKYLLLPAFLFLLLIITTSSYAQKAGAIKDDIKAVEAAKDQKLGWTKNGGIGLDFSQLGLINPRFGAGSNRTGFGGLLTYTANYYGESVIWNNRANLQLAILKDGVAPFTKSLDVLQFTSQLGRKISAKWYLGGMVDFQTQFLPTYGLNYLSETPTTAIGKQPFSGGFLSPAILKAALGAIYKPDAHWTMFFPPLAAKTVIVTDQRLVNSGAFFPPDSANNKTVDFQPGAEVRLDYINKFANDRIGYQGGLDLYSNYLRNPQNIAIEFYNSLDFYIIKNFSINLKVDAFYDDDIEVYRGGDVKAIGKDVFIREALLVKYTHAF